MAQILIKADTSAAEKSLKELQSRIQELQTASSKVQIKIDSKGIDTLDKDALKSVNALTKLANAQARLQTAQNKAQAAQNRLNVEMQKSAQAASKAAAAEEKTKQAVEKTKQAVEKTKQAQENYRTATEKTAQAEERTSQAFERSVQAREKTAQAAEKTAQAEEKTRQAVEKTNQVLAQSEQAANSAAKASDNLITSFLKYNALSQVISTVKSAFSDALQTMKDVDAQLVTVRKVTGMTTEEIDALQEKAYSTASKYGVTANDYLESVAEFARAGYGDVSDSLAELSTKTQIVGDTTSEIANKFLLAMDAAYQYHGSVSELTKVLDGANEIDNKYATSIEKIAEGLGIVAPVAAQMHVTEDELSSAIGTITAVTQRSGAEAARALRALFLNILGDTTTEIEDGVTATEESVSSLRSLLQEYAPDALAAADATGQIIDPMEAIGSLSKAMQDGLLTEQELMSRMSDLGGKLRTTQLVALVSNWNMYESMLTDYGNAVGSADKEIENAMDSWERKAAVLANTWTEFVQGTIDTEFIKDLLDGVTKLLKAFGSLDNMLITVGGAIAAFKLPTIVKSVTSFAKTVGSAVKNVFSFGNAVDSSGNKLSGFASAVNVAQGALAIATVAYTAYTMAANAHRNAVEESTQAALEEATAAQEEADNILDLWSAYNSANEAYEAGTGTKEELTEATNALATALGIEGDATGLSTEALEANTQAALDNAKAKTQAALNAAKYNFQDQNKAGANTGNDKIDALINGITGMGTASDLQNAILASDSDLDGYKKLYKTYKKIVDEYTDATENGGEATQALANEYKEAMDWLGEYGDSIGEIIDLEDQLASYDGIDLSGMTSGDMGEVAEGVDSAAKSFSGLAEQVVSAQTAIEKFNNATQTEKDDEFQSYAEIYEKFLTDWEAGLKGSNTVNEAIKALLPEDMISDLWSQGKDAGEVLASEFYQGIFTYVDENGTRQFTKGEDRGSLLAYALWDNDSLGEYESASKKVIKLGDEVVASITQDGEELSVSVDDFDKLSEALYNLTGVSLSGDVLASWMQSLGMFDSQAQYTISELNEMAEAVGALNESGQIDLQSFVTGQIDLGTSAETIRQMVDELLSLNEAGDISVDIGAESVEEAKEKITTLLEEASSLGETSADVSADADTDDAETSLDDISGKVDEINEKDDISISTSVTGNAQTKLESLKSTLASIPTSKTINITTNSTGTNFSGGGTKFATGTSGAPGGMTLVNEQGAEVIQEGASARIAGGGKPTITWVEPGARIFNAVETKSILAGNDPEILYDGIGAFAGGTAKGITRWKASKSTAKASASGTAVGSSAAKGSTNVNTSTLKTSATEKTQDDERLKQLQDIVSLRQSELSLLEAQEAPVKDQISKQKQIQTAIMNEINYLKSIGGSQEEINKLYVEWYNVQKEIADLQDSLYSELKDAISGQIDKLNEKREEEKQAIQDQLDLMEEQRNARDNQLELEEKILAVQEAEKNLQNAMTERTVRYYNASTGQWEWSANATDVKSAAEELENAQKALKEYQDDQAYEDARAELEAQQDAIDAKYDELENRWNAISDSLEEPVISIKEALELIANNYIPEMKTDVINLNKLLSGFGYYINGAAHKVTNTSGGTPVYDNGGVLKGMGGIKATALDEMVLPPDVTSKMLSLNAGTNFEERLNELRYMYGGADSFAGSVNNSIGTQYNGDRYSFGNITLSEQQANTMTVAQLARASRNLRLYSSAM